MADFVLKAVSLCGNLIANKVRTKIALNLKESDLTGQQFRDWIIKPLDEIKDKLEGMARKDPIASTTFLKQGIISLEEHIVRVGKNEEMKEALVKRLEELCEEKFKLSSEDAKSPTPGEDNSWINDAHEQFDLSAQYAVLAFSNKALKLSDRVNAAKLRIIAAIFRHINNVQISLSKCNFVLEQLNSNKEIMSNYRAQFGKEAVGALRRLLPGDKKDERKELIQSVASINRMVWDYAHFCLQADDSYFTDWPLISLDSEHQLHPVLDGGIREICGERKIHSFAADSWPQSLSVTESGTLFVVTTKGVETILPNGKIDCVCRCPHREPQPQKPGETMRILDDAYFTPRCAVSTQEEIFVSYSRRTRDGNRVFALVRVYNSEGSLKN